MIKLQQLSFLIAILCIIPGSRFGYAHEAVTGIQSGVWSRDKSPYIVKGNIRVPRGLVLEIEKGVIVKFAGDYRIAVNGALIANGSKEQPIVFTSLFDNEFAAMPSLKNKIPQPSDWQGVEFSECCDEYISVLNYCIIRYSDWAIRCDRTRPILTNIVLVDNARQSLIINNQQISFESGQKISPITRESRGTIPPLPEPTREPDPQKIKRLLAQQKLEQQQRRFRMLQDSIRKALKIKPILSKTGQITLRSELFDAFDLQSLPALISYAPGFLNIATIWTGNQLTARGIAPTLSNNRLLFQWNGLPFFEPIARTSFLEFIALDAIDRIEIDRGTVLSPFNHHGVIGAANLVPRFDQAQLVNRSKVILGAFGTKELTAFLALNKDSTHLNLATNFRNSAGYWKTVPPGGFTPNFRQKFGGEFYNFSLMLKHPLVNVATSYFEHNQFQLGLIPQLQYASPISRRGFMVSLTHEIKMRPNFHAKLIGNLVSTYERAEIGSLSSMNNNGLDKHYYLSRGNVLSVSLLSQYTSAKYLLSAGLTSSRFSVDPLFQLEDMEDQPLYYQDGESSSGISYYEHSAFARLGYNFSPFFGFDSKTCVNFVNLFRKPEFSFDAKIIYNPFLPFDSYLRFSRTVRRATLLERKIYLPGLFYGNDQLRNEVMEQVEWSTDIHIKQNLTTGFILYHSKSNQLIRLNQDYIFSNQDRSFWTTGGEWNFHGTIGTRFYVLGSFNYNQVQESGWDYPTYQINGITRVQWSRKFATLTGIQYLSQFHREIKFSNYYLMNLTFVYQLFPRIKVILHILDVLDQNPEYPEYIRGEIPAIPAGPGRSFFITMNIE